MVVYRYIDIIWLNNACVNFLILYLVWRIAKNSSSLWRLMASASMGALYAVLLLVPSLHFLSFLPFKLILSILMVLLAYRVYRLKDFLKLIGFFYAITFLLAGSCFAFFYASKRELMVENGLFIIEDFPIRLILYSATFLLILYRTLWPLIVKKINTKNLIYRIRLYFEGQIISLDVLLDTGNDLCDPINKSPVMLVEYDLIKQVLPLEIKRLYRQGGSVFQLENKEIKDSLLESGWLDRFRLIPYASVNGSGLIMAYKPDKASILIDGRWEFIKDIMVGIKKERLTFDNEYHGLIQPQILP